MRIENSSIQLYGSSTSIEQQTKDESLKMWVGNRRPTFPDENPINLFDLSENPPPGDTLELSAEGKAALEKQLAASSAGSITNEDGEDLLTDKDKQKLYMLQKMIEALTGKKLNFIIPKKIKLASPETQIQALPTGRQLQPI